LKLQGGRWYVGLDHKSKICERMRKHKKGLCHFTSVYELVEPAVYLCWPARDRACEAYVYALLLADPSIDSLRVGGFDMTSSAPSPLQRFSIKQSQRAVRDLCFRCGSAGHVASACKASEEHVRYRCNSCAAWNSISGAGASRIIIPGEAQPPKGIPPASICSPPFPEVVGPSSPDVAGPPLPDAADKAQAPPAPPPEPRFVLVGGKDFSTLKWFLGPKPAPSQTAQAREFCMASAVQFRGAILKSFAGRCFTDETRPAVGDLLSADLVGQPVTKEWMASVTFTNTRSDRQAPEFRVVGPGDHQFTDLRSILFARCDLEGFFGQ